MKLARRYFLKLLILVGALIRLNPKYVFSEMSSKSNMGVSEDGFSHIYVSKGGTPEQNIERVLEMIGGIRQIIDPDDIVILKPNAQWWNQGMTNTDTIKGFISAVLLIPGFDGEIIIAENHQYQQDESRGWTTNSPNGSLNLNELVDYFQKKGFKNVTKYHWHCAGPNKGLIQGDAHGDNVVKGPEDGDGYVWRDDMVYAVSNGRKTMMTYPIFTSSYSGITIDLKNGAWKNGKYLNKKVKLINFPSLNHHSNWAGVTCCIKNYLGVVDMSCGYHGTRPKGFYNFHYAGNCNSHMHPLLEKVRRKLGIGYFEHFHGGPVGYYMKNVRMADLNVVTAEWVGYGSRTDTELSARPKAVLASTDPVALDYYAAKYFLLPFTPRDLISKSGYHPFNDPDNLEGPFRRQIEECHNEGIGNPEESKMKIHKFVFKA